MAHHVFNHDGYEITDDRKRLDPAVIHGYLSDQSYWAKGISREQVEISLANSLCLGVYAPEGQQVGLARIVTDSATFAWLCDVFVIPGHRGRGLGKALVRAVVGHPQIQHVRRIALATLDAHALYAQFGFTPLTEPPRHMERRRPTAAAPRHTS